MMLSSLLFLATAQAAHSEDLTFDFIERLKFRSMKRIESGRFAYEGTVEIGGEKMEMSSWAVVRGDATRSSTTMGDQLRLESLATSEKMIGVIGGQNMYFEQEFEKKEEVQEGYVKQPIEDDSMNFSLTGRGPSINFGKNVEPKFVAQGDEVRGDLKLHWVMHERKTEEKSLSVKQWFYADTWNLYEFLLESESPESGKVSAHFKASKWETDVEIKDEEIALDTEGMTKIPTPPQFQTGG